MSESWDRVSDVTCVICPGCAFTFDDVHADEDGSYNCPLCEAAQARAEERRENISAIFHDAAAQARSRYDLTRTPEYDAFLEGARWSMAAIRARSTD